MRNVRFTKLTADGTPCPADIFTLTNLTTYPALPAQDREFRTPFHLPGLDTPEGRHWRYIATGMPFFYDHTRALPPGPRTDH
jgi:hypothetical protein